jgi:hypothetical protein
VITNRISIAKRYLEVLHKSFEVEWDIAFRNSQSSGDWMDRLVLIHPRHYASDQSNMAMCSVRGTRAFPTERVTVGNSCFSMALWGYECEIDLPLAADHLFPWALGGPTDPRNKIFLCKCHNGLKGSDIHLYPWETGEPLWLREVLLRVSVMRGRRLR